MLEEVVKEPLLNPHPFCLPKGGNAELVVDPEDVLQVLPPTTAMKVCANRTGSRRATLADLLAEAGFLQVLVVVGPWVSTRRADHPSDMAAAHSLSPAHLWGD